MEDVGAGAGPGGQDRGRVGRQGGIGYRLSREDERVGGADAVTVEGGRHVDQHDVRDVLGAGVGHGPRNGAVERAEDDLGRGGGAAALALRPEHTRFVWSWEADVSSAICAGLGMGW